MPESEGSAAQKKENNTVPLEVEELAYAMNAARDAKKDVTDKEIRLNDSIAEKISLLVSDTPPEHDEFLRAYQDILLMGSSKLPRVKQFEQALELRSKLVPGEFLLVRDEVVQTREADQDGADGIRPKVTQIDRSDIRNMISRYNDTIYLTWEVPLVDSDNLIEVNDGSVLGGDDVLKHLDRKWAGDLHDRNLLMYVPLGVVNYERIGEPDKAKKLKSRALDQIRNYFEKDVFTQKQVQSADIMAAFFVLRQLSPEDYDELIVATKKYAGSGQYTSNILQIIKHVADENARDTARANPGSEYSEPTSAQKAQLFADFAKEGEELLANEPKS